MFYVYVTQSQTTGKFCVGQTQDLHARRAASSSVGRVRRGGLIRVSVVRAHPGELSSKF